MKRPSLQFYPGDWRNNAKLRRCSGVARGAWMDLICLFHDSDEYGVVRWTLAELARAAGVSLKVAKELAEKHVLKGADSGAEPYVHTPTHAGKNGEPVILVQANDGPVWFCSRMVRDEWLRGRRGIGTRFDSENQPNRAPSGSPTPRVGERQGDGASSSSSSSSSHSIGDGKPTGAREREPASPSPDQGKAPPKRAQVAKAMTDLGVTGVNPTHAKLIALLGAGAEIDEFRDAAIETIEKGKRDFGYILATIEGRRREAAAAGQIPTKKPSQNAPVTSSGSHKFYVPEKHERRDPSLGAPRQFKEIAADMGIGKKPDAAPQETPPVDGNTSQFHLENNEATPVEAANAVKHHENALSANSAVNGVSSKRPSGAREFETRPRNEGVSDT